MVEDTRYGIYDARRYATVDNEALDVTVHPVDPIHTLDTKSVTTTASASTIHQIASPSTHASTPALLSVDGAQQVALQQLLQQLLQQEAVASVPAPTIPVAPVAPVTGTVGITMPVEWLQLLPPELQTALLAQNAASISAQLGQTFAQPVTVNENTLLQQLMQTTNVGHA